MINRGRREQHRIGDNPSIHKTVWRSRNIWFRREFTLDKTDFSDLYFHLNHDDNAEVYLNGEKILRICGLAYQVSEF